MARRRGDKCGGRQWGEVEGGELEGGWWERECTRWLICRRLGGGTARRPGGGAAPAFHVPRGTAPPTLDRIAALADMVVGGKAPKESTGGDVKLRGSGPGFNRPRARWS